MASNAPGVAAFARLGENTTRWLAPNSLRKVIAVLALVMTSARRAGSCDGGLNEMVTIWQPRFEASCAIWADVMLYVCRICGNWVTRRAVKPVSFMTSRMSVNGTLGK